MDINSKYYIAFASDESIGSNFVKKLYDFFGDIEQAWFASTSNLYKIKNLSEKKN